MDDNKATEFWDWFTENEAALFDLKHRKSVLEELESELDAFHPHLYYEVSSIFEGKRELLISADGVIEYFPFVT